MIFKEKIKARKTRGFLADMISKLTSDPVWIPIESVMFTCWIINSFEIKFTFYDDLPQGTDFYFTLFSGHS